MKTEPTVHHHFHFSKPILETPQSCKHITFEYMPFFKLYAWEDYERIKTAIHCLTAPIPTPHKKLLNKLRPSNKEVLPYREDIITMQYCVVNKQKFFVRGYFLRHNGGEFFKVEITLHSNTLSDSKHYTWERLLNSANRFFDIIEDKVEALNPIGLHADDYFFPQTFQKKVSVLQHDLNLLRDTSNPLLKRRLIDELKYSLADFECNAVAYAQKYLTSVSKNFHVAAHLSK